jgi:hypothetical protein
MPSPGDLAVTVEVVPDEITAEDVLDEFIATMDAWGHAPWVRPASVPLGEQVMLPEPDVLAVRASLAARMVLAAGSGRS